MTTPSIPLAATLLVALWAPLAAQAVPLARGNGGGALDLVSIDEGTLVTTTVVADAVLLPLGLAGRPLVERYRSDRPAGRDDGVAPRVRLPTQGSLYRVQTPATTLLLLVRVDGTLEVLLERPSTGSPTILDAVAASDDGGRVLVATSPEAGGDVLAITLDPAPSTQVLTGSLGPVSVAPESLRVSASLAWFVADGQVHRVRFASGTVEPVTASYEPGEVVLPELAVAGNGRRAAWVTELPGGGRHVWAAALQGPAGRLTTTPGDIDPPSYASAEGPLLVTDGGSPWVAWREHVPTLPTGSSEEVFARRIADATPGAQLTQDGAFIDTIDSVGVLGFIATGRLTFLAGEPPDEPSQVLGSADVYLADLAQPGVITNLSLSSGIPSAPFVEPGELEVLDVFEDPTGSMRLMLVDPADGDFAVLAQSLGGGPLTAPFADLELELEPRIDPAGDALLVQLYPKPLVPTDPRQELRLLRSDGSVVPVVETTASITVDRFAAARDGSRAAFIASVGPGLEVGLRLDLQTAGLELLWSAFLGWAPRLAFTASGRVAAGLGAPDGPYLFVGFDGPSTGVVLPGGVGQGFPLDG